MNTESYDPEYPSYYENGCFYQYPAGITFFGLVDINSDGLPEVFKFLTYSDRNTSKIYFYDRDTKSLLTDEDIYGFNLDEGATYFGKNKDGNLLICKGYPHSNYMGYFIIAELLIDENDEKLTYSESFRADFGLFNNVFACWGYSVNGEQYGENYDITADEFESAYREFYDAIDFDVYWICGDILYHGAEETEYKGKMAYEKYLEFTVNKTVDSRSALLKPYELDINIMSEKEKDNLDFTNIRKELSSLDDDTLTKIEKAYIIARGISFCNIVYTGNFSSNLDDDSGVYCYGILYESYFDYLKTVFTEDMIDKLFADNKLFVDIDGELCKVGIGDRGSDPLYDYGVYSIKSTDSEKIEITLTAYRSDGDIVYQPSSYDIVLVKVDGEWKVNEFEYWI